MVDLGGWNQIGKIGFQLPTFGGNNSKKDDKKAQDTKQKEDTTPPSFQGAENLKEEADKIKNEKKSKLDTDSSFRNQEISKFKADDNKASWKNTGELGYKQTVQDIKSDWKNDIDDVNKAYEQDLEKAKEDGKYTFGEYLGVEGKDTLRKGWAGTKNVVKTILKGIGGAGDYVADAFKEGKAARDARVEARKQGASKEEQDKAYDNALKETHDKRINKLLTKDIDEEDTVKELATDRMIQNATIVQNKEAEIETSIDEINTEYTEVQQLEAQVAQMEEDRKNGKVSGPERDTNYLATVNALKSKKTSLEEKTNLLYQKLDEYDQLQKEHQLKEYELLPYTDNYYETEAEAQRYRNLFGDKLYKNEDGTLFSQGDQKDKDVYSIMKNLERVLFSSAEGVRDENVGKFWSLFGFTDDYKGFETGGEYLKNSEKFLNMSYDTFADLKQKLLDNYDSLCDVVQTESGEEMQVLNQDKVAAFLKQNESGLAQLSDYIITAKEGTSYMDIKFGRYQDGDEGKLTQYWKDLGGLSDLLWSMTTSQSKQGVGPFHYDKARDWINMSTGNFGFGDAMWQMIAQNPAKTAYICGSMYFAVRGSGVYSMNPEKATQLGKLDMLGKFNAGLASKTKGMLGIYSQTKKGEGVVSMAQGLSQLKWLTPTKSKFWNRVIDTTVRKGIGTLDEVFVSLPLDLGLNDKTQRDLNLNIIFNTLGGLGKIQSISDMTLFKKTLANQGSAEAMEKYFIEYTQLPELAKGINWSQDASKAAEEANAAIWRHWKNIMNTDSHKAAWFMSQYIAKNIDSFQWEQMDEIEAFAKAIVEDGNIGASLGKNRAKNITQILSDAKAKLGKTKDGTQILTIQNAAVAKIKSEFKAILDSFDVEKLNKLYKRKFAADEIGQGFVNFIEQREKSTGVPKEDLMLIFMDSMNKRVGKEGLSVVDVFNQRVVQGLSDGSIKSSKGAKAGIKGAKEASQTTAEGMGKLLDVATVAEKDPEKAANLLNELEEKRMHDTREALKGGDAASAAAEESKINKEFEETTAAINARKEEKMKEAEDLRESVSDVTKKDYTRFDKTSTPADDFADDTWVKEFEESSGEKAPESLDKGVKRKDADGVEHTGTRKQMIESLALDNRVSKTTPGNTAAAQGYNPEEDWTLNIGGEKYGENQKVNVVDKQLITKDEAHYFEWLRKNKTGNLTKGTDSLSQMKESGRKIENYAKQISNDPELLGEIAEEEQKFLKANGDINYDDIVKQDKERWMKSFEENAEEEGLTLEEYMKKYNIEYDETLKNRAIENRKKENKAASETRETLPADKRLQIIEDYLTRKYGFDFKSTVIESEEDFNKAQKEIIEPIYEKELNPLIDTRGVFVSKTKMKKTDPAKNIADKLDFKFDKTKNTWSMNGDLNSLSAKEKKELQTALKEAGVSTDLTKENIEAAVNKLESDIAVVEKKIADKRKALRGGGEENPYKEFSRLVNNYIEDKQNISKVTDGRLTSTENLESIFTKIVGDDTSEEALARYNKILEKLEPAGETITKAADETAETAIRTAEEIEAEAEKQAAKELADAEQVRLSAINEVKKRGLSQKIVDGVNKVLDFFENNVPIVKKTGILDTTRKVANTMNDVTQKNFLGSLGETISGLIKGDPNSSIVKNLAQTIIDGWSTSFRKGIIRDITKAVTKADGSVDMVKLKDFAGNLYSPKRKNQIKNGELEDVIKDLMQQKVAQNMTLSVLNPANINNAEKTAQEIAADVIADTTSKIKDPTMAKINQKLGKQSADAMVLYQQAVDTAARKMNDTAQALADQAELKKAQDSVSAMSNKRVNKQKKKSAMEQVDELVSEEKPVAEATEQNALAGMDKNLAGNIKANAEREAKLGEGAKRAENYASQERLTEKEKTLMRFGAVEEAQKIMDATSKGKKPGMIKAEFLDGEGFAFLTKLLNFGPDEGKQFDLFYQAFVESRRKTQGFGYQLFHSLKNLMFDGSSSIKTANGQYKLNDILKSIPSRITSNIKGSNGGVIYDPRVTMTKYMMESNPKEATEFMKGALTDYFKGALAKDSRADLGRRFLQVFDKEASNLDMPSVVADEFMNLYTKVADRLRSYGVEDRVVQDILNPMFYNPLEYIRGIGMSSHPATKTVLKGGPMEDMVVGTILKKWIGQGNNLPEELGELYLSTKKGADYFEKFAGGSIIRNRNALEFGDALGEYYNKVDSLPIGQEQFADWMNKTLGNIVNMGDDVTRKATALESLMTPMYDKARRLLGGESDEYKEFMESVDKFLFSEDGGLKHSKELKEGFEEFQNSVKKFGLDDAETNEILETVKRSIDAKETGESRVITNYLYDRASKNADEFMKQTGKAPDKFTPADIMNRKTMQEAVMDEYNKKSTEELVNQIQAAEKHTKQTSKEGKTYFEHKSKENVKKMVESYGIDAEEAKDIDTLLSNEDFEKLLKDGELSPEAAQKQILKRMLSNKETFEKLMAENGFFKGRVDETLSKVLDEKNLKAGQEYFTVGKNGEFVLRQKADKFNALQRFAAKLTTKGNVMSKDRETAGILAGLNKTKETAYVSNQIDFGKILGKSDLDVVGRNVGLDAYISMGQSSVYKLAKKLDKKNADNIIAEAVNRVFKNLPDSSMDEMMSSPAAKDFVLFLENYKQGIDKTRKTLDLGDQWKYLFEGTDLSTKGVGANKLANRLGGMWNFLSTDDIARLSTKYDASKGMGGLWSNFTKNIIYNARADLSDSSFMRGLAKFNFATQKYAIVKNYNVTQFTKAGQQVASNMLHAQGILRSVAVAGTSEFDELYKVIQNSEMRNLGFDIFESEGKYGERLLDKTTVKYGNKGEKTRQKLTWKKDGNFLKNTWLFGKDLATSNALMRGDKATQKRAVKSSLALATDEMYRLGGEQAVQEFTNKFDRFTRLLDQYGIKERDLMNSDRFFDRSIQILNSPKAKAKAGFTNAQTHEYFTKSKDDMQFIYDFYRNEYAPFMGKARTSMGTFFVMDDIKELGSIQVIDNNKYMFGLMKWSLGKMGEYMFDVGTAFNKFDGTRRGFRDVVSDPIFKRMYSELTEGARAMWEVEKFTNDEFTIRDGMKATVVPVAALSMFIGEAIMDWGEKTFSSEEWDKGGFDFVKYVIGTSLDTAIDFVTDRMFIYAGMFGTDFGSSLNTANVVGIENGEEFREAFLHTWARKFYTNNPIDKFSHIRSSGYGTSALDLIKPETILAEIGLNQTSSARQTLNDINTAIYDLQKNYYETNDKWYNKMLNRVPVIKNAKQAGKDMGVLLPMLDKKVQDSGAYGFLKETTPRSELARLINTMEKNIMLEKDDFKTWAMQNIKDVNALSDDELKTAMIKAGVYTDDLKAWEIVKNGLNKQNLSGKGESTLRLQMMDDDERSALFEEFDNMYQTYVIDKGKADVATTSMFDKFVLAATKYGGSMSMAGYMGAYATAYKAAARKYYGLTSSEVTAGDKGDEWLAAEENIDVNNLPDSKYGNYIKYVDEVRSFEQAFIVDNWDVLTREKSIGIDMLNTYIENDKENFGWNSYLGSIGDEKSNMAKLWNILNYNKVAADQGLQGVILPLAYQEKKAADGYLLALDGAKTPEDIALVGEKFLGIQESLGGLAERFSDNPQTEGLIKASLASGLVSFAEEIEKKSPGMLEKVIDIIGEKAINKVLNSLTDSPTVTMADAFELATGVNAHSGSGKGKGKSLSIPSAKARENYVNKMLIPNYNKAKAAAAATGGGGGTDLPKFTTAYGRAKDGSIVAAKIPVPTRKNVTRTYDTPTDTKTDKLDVAPLPVKEGRVIGGKYTARAIQNAKVYSRRIGR